MPDVQRRQAEEAGTRIDELSGLVADLVADGLIISHQSTVLYSNTAALRMLGAAARDEVIGTPLSSYLHPDSFAFLRNQPEAASIEQVVRTEGRMLRVDGRSIEVVLTASRIPWQGRAARLILLSPRATQPSSTRGSQDEIGQTGAQLELVSRAGQVGLFEHTHGSDACDWSPILREICGIGADEPVSLQRYIDLIPFDERDRILSELHHTCDPAGVGTCQIEHRLIRGTADLRYVRVRTRTLFEGEGLARRPVRTLGAVVDITNVKKAETSQRDLSQIHAIGILAGGIAHEFNNRLTAVLGFSELALPLIPTDSKAHRHIEQVVIAGRKSRELVHQLLAFSQPGDHVRHPLSLHSLLKESLKLLRPTISSWIELRERITPTARPISAEAAHMHGMILRLVEHALHNMRRTGGVLEIGLHDETLPVEHHTSGGLLPAGCYVCLTVRDTGEALPRDMANPVFDPSVTTLPSTEGARPGLSVVHDIVMAHGGTLLLDSGPGLGTTVSVYLPALSPPVSPSSKQDEPLPHGHECILFVDDDEALARFGGEMLESLGYYPVVRLNAAEAWKAFQIAPQRFDLVITDRAMPGMTGEMLTRECQRLRPDLPAILCTGSDAAISTEQATANGITEYILKPLTLQNLAHTIRRVLDARAVEPPAEDTQSTSTWLIEERDALSTRR